MSLTLGCYHARWAVKLEAMIQSSSALENWQDAQTTHHPTSRETVGREKRREVMAPAGQSRGDKIGRSLEMVPDLGTGGGALAKKSNSKGQNLKL